MRWLPYAFVCSTFLASADCFVKLALNKISWSMRMFIYSATAFTVVLIWVGYMKLTNQTLLITRPGLLYSIAVSAAFGAVTPLTAMFPCFKSSLCSTHKSCAHEPEHSLANKKQFDEYHQVVYPAIPTGLETATRNY